MPSFKLIVEYDGTRFHGFQRQTSTVSRGDTEGVTLDNNINTNTKRPKYHHKTGRLRMVATTSTTTTTTSAASHTIQSTLERAICHWAGVTDVRLRSSSRTDKGVHAKGQVVAIDLVPRHSTTTNDDDDDDNSNNNDGTAPRDKTATTHNNHKKNPWEAMELWEMQRATNSRLPVDICVRSFEYCDASFEPRHEAKSKRYSYTLRYRRRIVVATTTTTSPLVTVLPICNSGIHTLRTTLDGPCLWTCPWALDDSYMKDLCHSLTGTHDYTAFVHVDDRRRAAQDHNNSMTTLTRFDVEPITVESSHEAAPAVTVRFVLEARGFRRSMVRNLVGFVVEVCRGNVARADVAKVWSGTEEAASMVQGVPGSGLCLDHVQY